MTTHDSDTNTDSEGEEQVDLVDVGDTAQSGVDLADKIDQLADALQTAFNGDDELRTRAHNSSGTQIDPATTALENALKANDTDEFITRVTNSSGTEINPATTALENALKANDTDEFVTRVTDSSGTEIDPREQHSYDAEYTSVDLNTTGTTTIYNGSVQGKVYGVFLHHSGSTAEFQLEVTDGTNTGILRVPGAGSSLEFGDTIAVDSGDDLQINVTVAEGSSLTGTAVVFRGE